MGHSSRLLGLAFALLVGTASAQTISGEVSVHLSDGTVVHGTVSGVVTPGSPITITLSDGQARSIAWGDIARIEVARLRGDPLPPATQLPTATTLVHISGDLDGELLTQDERGGSEGAWIPVCSGMCDRELPTHALYRLGGSGVRKSKPFQLHGSREGLRASTASSAGFVGGLTMVIIGAGSIVNGAAYLALAELANGGFGSPDQGYLIAGGVLLGIGVVSLAIGVPLFGGNLRTVVNADETPRAMSSTDSARDTHLPPFQGVMVGIPFRF